MEVLDFGFLVLAGWTVTVREQPVLPPGAEAPPSSVPATVAVLQRYWSSARRHSWNDIFRAASLIDRLSEVAALPGDVVECGVSRGGTALLMAAALREIAPEKKLYLCDSFQGLPGVTSQDRQQWYHQGDFAATREGVSELLARHDLENQCTILGGWFNETLPTLSGVSLCMVHVDCDLYQSTMDCLTHLYPAVATGGAMVFDDYSDGSGGERAAVNAHVAVTGEVIHIGPYSQAYLYKGETTASTRGRDAIQKQWDGHQLPVSLSSLRDNAAYIDYVMRVRDRLRDITDGFEAYERICRGATVPSR
jgi:hypothetical protein